MPGLKLLLLRLLMRWVAAHKAPASDRPKKLSCIALWQFGGVGDMVLMTPVIRALSKVFPKARIHIWCSDPVFAEFFERFPNVASIRTFRVYDFDSRTLMHGDVRKHLQDIRDEIVECSPEMLINLHVPALLDWWAVEWWLVRQLRSAYTLGFDPKFIRQSIYDASLNAVMRDGTHYTTLYRRLLETAGITCDECTEIPLSNLETEQARTLLDKHGTTRQRNMCMHIGARRLKIEGKMWPLAYFTDLARQMVAIGIRPIIIGVDSEADMAAALCDQLPSCLNLAGKTSLGEMAALIAECDGFIGHDSGPFHIAAAVNTPCVAICGRNDAEPEYLKYNNETVAVLTASSPNQISVDTVFDTAMRTFGIVTA